MNITAEQALGVLCIAFLLLAASIIGMIVFRRERVTESEAEKLMSRRLEQEGPWSRDTDIVSSTFSYYVNVSFHDKRGQYRIVVNKYIPGLVSLKRLKEVT